MRRGESSLLRKIYGLIAEALGSMGWEDWWPAESDFERVVGSILIQRTRWENVDRAMAALKANGLLVPRALAACPAEELEALIRPAGFYRQKAVYLKAVAGYFSRVDITRIPSERLREELLGLAGVGDETSDVLLLYVAGRPRFVVDAYARRMLECAGIKKNYEELQAIAAEAFGEDPEAYRRLHAYIVEYGKKRCNKKACDNCLVKKYLG